MRIPSIAILTLFLACALARPPPEPPAEQAAKPAPAAAPTEVARRAALADVPASIYFDYDRSNLKPGARSALQTFFQRVQKRPDLHVRIEGNCDERGSEQYNLALGQRRADAAKKYLDNLGVKMEQITAISFGAERPKATGHDEEAWKQNRRDDVNAQKEATPAK